MTITVMNFPLYFHHLVQRPNLIVLIGTRKMFDFLTREPYFAILFPKNCTKIFHFIRNEISTHYRQKLALPFFLRLLILTVSSLVFSQNLWEHQNSSVQRNQTAFSSSSLDKLSHVDPNEKINTITSVKLIIVT